MLFGRSLARLQRNPLETEKVGTIATPQREGGGARGLFGGAFGRARRPRTLQVIGATLRQIADPNDAALDQFQANEAEQARYDAEQAALMGRQKNQDSAIATLDPSIQPWARLAPGEVARRMLAPPERPTTRYDSNTGNFWQDGEQGPNIVGRMPGWRDRGAEGGSGSTRVQYRPVTPEEAQTYNLPGNGAGFVMGSNGRPVRVGGGGSFSPDQRARVEIGLDPAIEAVRMLDQIELRGNMPVAEWNRLTPDQRRARTRSTPRNSEWGASIVDAIDGDDNTSALARNMGGQSFQQATSASSAFESGMLPILSGAAVTDSEARRMIRAAIPQLGDGPDVLAQKARRRHQMLNGAAIIGGRAPPYPEEAVPSWASNYSAASANTGGGDEGLPDGITPEEWEVMTPEERAIFQ